MTETISWGVLYYAFAVYLAPMEAELGWSRGDMTGACCPRVEMRPRRYSHSRD